MFEIFKQPLKLKLCTLQDHLLFRSWKWKCKFKLDFYCCNVFCTRVAFISSGGFSSNPESNGFKTPKKTNTFSSKSEQPMFMEFSFLMASSQEKWTSNISLGILYKAPENTTIVIFTFKTFSCFQLLRTFNQKIFNYPVIINNRIVFKQYFNMSFFILASSTVTTTKSIAIAVTSSPTSCM